MESSKSLIPLIPTYDIHEIAFESDSKATKTIRLFKKPLRQLPPAAGVLAGIGAILFGLVNEKPWLVGIGIVSVFVSTVSLCLSMSFIINSRHKKIEEVANHLLLAKELEVKDLIREVETLRNKILKSKKKIQAAESAFVGLINYESQDATSTRPYSRIFMRLTQENNRVKKELKFFDNIVHLEKLKSQLSNHMIDRSILPEIVHHAKKSKSLAYKILSLPINLTSNEFQLECFERNKIIEQIVVSQFSEDHG